jgi:hypothetical protein
VLEWLGLDDDQRERVAPVVLAQLEHLTRLPGDRPATASHDAPARG